VREEEAYGKVVQSLNEKWWVGGVHACMHAYIHSEVRRNKRWIAIGTNLGLDLRRNINNFIYKPRIWSVHFCT